jgi:uncharacterized protein (DUF486 family)
MIFMPELCNGCGSLPPAKTVLMSFLLSPKVLPVLLLVASNVFMTLAWYGHLKFKTAPLYAAVLASWMIAFVEYWLAVPANRIGHGVYSAAELKTMQEVITLAVFAVFSVLYLKEAITWNHLAGFALIAAGAAMIFRA